MKKNIAILGVFIVIFLGVTFLISKKFQGDIQKEEAKLEKVKKPKEDLPETYRDVYKKLLESENGKGLAIEEKVNQYLEVTKDSIDADFIVLENGDTYIGFPRLQKELSDKIQDTLEPFEFVHYVTSVVKEEQRHTFIGKKIAEDVKSLYFVKINQKDQALIYISQSGKVGVIDFQDIQNINVTLLEDYQKINSIIQSKTVEGYQVIALGKEPYNITELIMKK